MVSGSMVADVSNTTWVGDRRTGFRSKTAVANADGTPGDDQAVGRRSSSLAPSCRLPPATRMRRGGWWVRGVVTPNPVAAASALWKAVAASTVFGGGGGDPCHGGAVGLALSCRR